VLGPFGPPCALREHGQRLAGTVLLLSLWKHGTDYEPRATVAPAVVVMVA
jgi:hypothetical protein